MPDCAERRPIALSLSILESLASYVSAVGGPIAPPYAVLRERNLEAGVWMLRRTWAAEGREEITA